MKRLCIVFTTILIVATTITAPFVIAAPNLDGTITCSSTKSDGTEFVPSLGKAVVDKDQYSRYIIQYMYWHDDNRLKWLWSNPASTFEPDAFFYNYDGKAYGSAPSGYWSSDLPDPYVDTQALDGSNEKAITIGSALAVAIVSKKVYYTLTRMAAGGGDSSKLKLQAHRGLRWPDFCFSTNCSYGCNAQNNYRLVPFSDFTAPGCHQYWWLWSITSNSPC